MEGAEYCRIKSDGEMRLATENLVPGNQVYGEKLVRKNKTEYRVWDPFRSKLAGAIMNGLEVFPFHNKNAILYLGASSGTTVSHLSDIVGRNGTIFAIDHASRSTRDLLDRVVKYRPNVIPVLQDAKRPDLYSAVYGMVDAVYSDIAQPDQTEIAVSNCKMFLKPKGHLVLVVKIRAIHAAKSHGTILEEETAKLGDFEIIQTINLYPYDKDHYIILAKFSA